MFGPPSLEDYLALIPSIQRVKPKFAASVTASVQPFIDLQIEMQGFSQAYDLDNAVGAQLDATGGWVGASRVVNEDLPNVYFAFDDTTHGFDEAFWRGAYDASFGAASLDDFHYREFIYAKIGANQWDGTIENAVEILALIFPYGSGTTVFFEDRQDMSMVFAMVGTTPDALTLALVFGGYLPLKPFGVKLWFALASLADTPLFGFDVQNSNISGMDVGCWGSNVQTPGSGIIPPGTFILGESLLDGTDTLV